jgi:hypothetical protein
MGRVPAFLVVAVSGVLPTGCGSGCRDAYPEGTRLRVTVPEAFAGCHVTFDAGATYDLVAGSTTLDHRDCEYNNAVAPPVFTSAEFTISECRGDVNHMGIDCATELPSCADDYASHVRFFYLRLPEKPGQAVSTHMRMSFVAGVGCGSCDVDIPVVIRW